MPKEKTKQSGVRALGPLEAQLNDDATVEARAARKAAARAARIKKALGGDDDGEDGFSDDEGEARTEAGAGTYVPAKISRRILDEARLQQMEDEEDPAFTGAAAGRKKSVKFGAHAARSGATAAASGHSFLRAGGMDGEEDEEENEVVEFDAGDDVELEGEYISARMGGMDEATLASEEALLRRFMPEAPQARRTLADIIMEKMKEAEAMKDADAAAVEAEESGRPALDPKIVEVYSEVGRYLSHYKSGKLPKVFKVIPGLSNWEEILFLTNPETWTPHATYAATRIFASSFNAVKAQRFYNLILLPKCRDDVYFNKRMNFHLYMALKKATYKPAGFYKGIILPLVASGDCTLREAIIFSSVVAKVSIPQMHSAAALMKIASAPYTGATSVFLKVFMNKKYTLPYVAIDTLVDHFATFLTMKGPMPLVWHQSLLTLAQRYKADLTHEQKEMLKELMHIHSHAGITPEVRRELFSAGCRGDAPSVAPASGSTDAALLAGHKLGTATAPAAPAATGFAFTPASAAAAKPKAAVSGRRGSKGASTMELDF